MNSFLQGALTLRHHLKKRLMILPLLRSIKARPFLGTSRHRAGASVSALDIERYAPWQTRHKHSVPRQFGVPWLNHFDEPVPVRVTDQIDYNSLAMCFCLHIAGFHADR